MKPTRKKMRQRIRRDRRYKTINLVKHRARRKLLRLGFWLLVGAGIWGTVVYGVIKIINYRAG